MAIAVANGLAIGACGKVAHPSKSRANRALKRMAKKGMTRDRERAWQLDIYYCNICSAWHTGHSKFKRREMS